MDTPAIQEIQPVQPTTETKETKEEVKEVKDNKSLKIQIRIKQSERQMLSEMRQLDKSFNVSKLFRATLTMAYNEAKSKAQTPQITPPIQAT